MNIATVGILLELDDSRLESQASRAARRVEERLRRIPGVNINIQDNAADVAQRIQNVNNALRQLNNQRPRIDIDTSPAERRINSLRQQAERLQSHGYRNIVTGAAITGSVTAPILGAGAGALKFAGGFQENMQHLVTLTEVTKDQLAGLKQEVLALAADPKIRQGPTELADALYYVASTGLQGADAMKVLRASALGASAGLGDTQVVANTVTTVLDAYGLSADKAARVTDTLTEAVRYGKGEADKYAAAFPKVIAIAAQAGVTFEEVAAQMASATRVGLTPSETATALRQIFSNLIDPSEKSKRAMKELKTSVEEVRLMLREKGLFNTLKDLQDRTGGRIGAITELFGNIRALTGFLSTTGVGTWQEYKRTLHGIEEASGSTAKAAETAMETFSAQLKKLKDTAESVAITFGTRLLPVATGVVKAIGKDLPVALEAAIKTWNALPESVKSVTIHALALVAALGPLKMALGNLQILGSALTMLVPIAANPYILALLAGTALVAGIGIWQHFNAEMAQAKKTAEGLAKNAENLRVALGNAMDSAVNTKAEESVRELSKAVNAAGDDADKLDSALKKAVETERKIKTLGLAPNAADPLLAAVDAIIKTIENRRIVLKLTPEQVKEADRSDGARNLVKRAKSVGMDTRYLWDNYLSKNRGGAARQIWDAVVYGPQPISSQEYAEIEAEVNRREAEQKRKRDAQAQNESVGRRLSEMSRSETWGARAEKTLGNQKATLKDLVALQKEYNRLHGDFVGPRAKWQGPASAEDAAISGRVNKRVNELRKQAEDANTKAAEARKEREENERQRLQKIAEEDANRLRDIAIKQAQDQMTVWQTFGNYAEGAAGRVQQIAEASTELNEKTAEARAKAEMMKRMYEGIPEPLKDAVVQLSGIEYRMKKITDMRDAWRDIFQSMTMDSLRMGLGTGDIAALAGRVQGRMNYQRQMTDLQNRANAIAIGTDERPGIISVAEANRAGLSSYVEAQQEAGKKSSEVYEGGSGASAPSWLRDMEAATGKTFGRNCAVEITARLRSAGVSIGAISAASLKKGWQVGLDASGKLPAGTIIRWPPGHGGFRQGHYAAIGSDQAHFTESNMRRNGHGRDYISTDRAIDWAKLGNQVRSGVALAFAPPGSLTTTSSPISTTAPTEAPALPPARYARARKTAPIVNADPRLFMLDKYLGMSDSRPGILEDRAGEGESYHFRQQAEQDIINMILSGKSPSFADRRDLRMGANKQDWGAQVKAASVNAKNAVRDMKRELRMIGQEDNPLAALLDGFKHGADRFLPESWKQTKLRVALNGIKERAAQSIAEMNRDISIRAKVMAAANPMATEVEQARAQFVEQARQDVWNSPEMIGRYQAAQSLKKAGRMRQFHEAEAAMSRDAQTMIGGRVSEYDRKTQADLMRETGAATRQYGYDLKSLVAQREALARVAGRPEAAVNEELQQAIDYQTEYARQIEKTGETEARALAATYQMRQKNLRAAQADLDLRRQMDALSREAAEANARAGMVRGAMTPELARMLELEKFRQEFINKTPGADAAAVGLAVSRQGDNIDARNRETQNIQIATSVQDLAKSMATLGDETGLAALKFDLYSGSLKYADEAQKELLLSQTKMDVLRRYQLSADEEVLQSTREVAESFATSTRERLRIQYDFEDKVRRLREGAGGSRRPSEMDAIDEAKRAELMKNAEVRDRLNDLQGATRDAIATGFEQGVEKGVAAFGKNILDKLKQRAVDAVTDRVMGLDIFQRIAGYSKDAGKVNPATVSVGAGNGYAGAGQIIGQVAGEAVSNAISDATFTNATFVNPRGLSSGGNSTGAAGSGPSGLQALGQLVGAVAGGGKGTGGGNVFAGGVGGGVGF